MGGPPGPGRGSNGDWGWTADGRFGKGERPFGKGGRGHDGDLGLDADGGKGLSKGKGKKGKKKKTPEELGFERGPGGHWVRTARLKGGVSPEGADAVEVGNLDEAKAAKKGGDRLPAGEAVLEVLVNRQSILGNPFGMKKGPGGKPMEDPRERSAVIAAYKGYLDEVLEESCSAVDIKGLTAHYGLTVKDNCGKDWAELYENSGGPPAVRAAFRELNSMVASHRKRGLRIRLLCHCVPKGCHAEHLAVRLGDHQQAPANGVHAERPTPAPPAAPPPPRGAACPGAASSSSGPVLAVAARAAEADDPDGSDLAARLGSGLSLSSEAPAPARTVPGGSASAWQEALAALDALRQGGSDPGREAYAAAISACERDGQAALAAQLKGEMAHRLAGGRRERAPKEAGGPMAGSAEMLRRQLGGMQAEGARAGRWGRR